MGTPLESLNKGGRFIGERLIRPFYFTNMTRLKNPSGFCFLVQIKDFVIQTSMGLQNLNMKGKTKRILVVVVK